MLIEAAMTTVETAINSYVLHGFYGMAMEMRGPIRLAFVLYIIFYGFSVLRGKTKLDLADMGFRLFKVMLIIAVTTEYWAFSQFVYSISWDTFKNLGGRIQMHSNVGAIYTQVYADPFDPRWDMPTQNPLCVRGTTVRQCTDVLARMYQSHLSQHGPTSVWANMDSQLMETLNKANDLIYAGFPNLSAKWVFVGIMYLPVPTLNYEQLILLVAGLFLMIMAILMYGSAAAIGITAMLNYAVVVVLTPIFVSFYMFESTKSMADSWLRTLLAIVLLPLILMLALGLVQQVQQLIPLEQTPNWGEVIVLCILVFASFLFIMQVPSLATGLAGAVAGTLDAGLANTYTDVVKKLLPGNK